MRASTGPLLALALALLVLGILVLGIGASRAGDAEADGVGPDIAPRVDEARKRVILPARVCLEAFAAGDPPGHHLVAWARGGAGPKALLRTPVPDVQVLDALERLGARPGDNLTAEAWEARADPGNPAPDARAEGTTLRVLVRLPDGSERPAADLLEDVDRRGCEWRLAGNRSLIPRWRSGCVVCLQSCPGAKVANRAATMRDLHAGRSRFRPSAWARELGEGARVEVALALE